MSLPSSFLRTARTSGLLQKTLLPTMGVRAMSSAATAQSPVRVSVTGAAGQIGYSLLFRIASGQVFGNRPVILQAIELPFAMDALKGVKMELEDCAFPLLKDVVMTSDINVGFGDADYVFLVGSKPRGPGMERADLLKDNGAIFQGQGKAINDNSKKSVKVLVVGNPANTNCLIAAHNAPNIDPTNFSAMTRLDHNRAVAQVVLKTQCAVEDVDKVIIWGNHSATQYPDLSHATIRGQAAKSVINDQKWIETVFIPDVQQRGAAIIKARKLSSAASAANGAIDHMRDWVSGTKSWTSMAVHSKGNPYGVDNDLYYSFPVSCTGGGNYKIVGGLKVDDFSAKKMAATEKELKEERDMVKHMFAY